MYTIVCLHRHSGFILVSKDFQDFPAIIPQGVRVKLVYLLCCITSEHVVVTITAGVADFHFYKTLLNLFLFGIGQNV